MLSEGKEINIQIKRCPSQPHPFFIMCVINHSVSHFESDPFVECVAKATDVACILNRRSKLVQSSND